MNVLHKIRGKIWACISVALLSYLIVTLSTTWVNNKTKASITHIQEIDLPLTSKGILVHSLFNAQSEDYENGLLKGEPEEINLANRHHNQIASLLDEMAKLVSKTHTELYPRILSLRDDYNEYFILASLYYMEAVQKEDIFSSRKKINLLGKLRANLDKEFQQVADIMQLMIVTDLGNNKQRLDHYNLLLQISFILFLIIATMVINWLANRELIVPLGKINKMIQEFSRGRNVDIPQANPSGDEIQELVTSFWHITHELEYITASRDYVDNIINNMSDSLIILDPDLIIQKVNQATLNLLNLTEEKLVGRSFREIFSHDKEAIAQALLLELLDGKPVNNLEALYINGGEQPLPVLFSASALYLPDGTLQGTSCLAREVSEFKERREQLEFLAYFDNLTNLPNRNLFFDRLTVAMNEARRYGHLFALLYLDLDQFKSLNDKYGHEEGDLALLEIARRLQKTVYDTDTVSRVGGDEFIILLSRVNAAADAKDVATRVLDAISKPLLIQGSSCVLGGSIGICLSSPELTDAEKIMKSAHTAMCAAKAQGRNRFLVSDQGYRTFARSRLHA